jgi:hypothetical protein
MNNTNIATIRTAFTAFWTSFAISIAAWAGWDIEVGTWQYILAVTVGGGIVWRISELLAQVPILGYILFGVNKAPGYDQPTPPNPVIEAPAPVDEGSVTLMDVVLVLGAIVLVIVLIRLL